MLLNFNDSVLSLFHLRCVDPQSAGRRRLRHSWGRRPSRWWRHTADGAPAGISTTFCRVRCARCSRRRGTVAGSRPSSSYRPSSPRRGSRLRRREWECRRRPTARRRARKTTPMETCRFSRLAHLSGDQSGASATPAYMSAPPALSAVDRSGRHKIQPQRSSVIRANCAALPFEARHSPRPPGGQRFHDRVRSFAGLLYRRRRRLQFAAVEHRVIAFVVFLKADRGREHIGSALRLLELVHPPVRHLTGTAREFRAGPVRCVDDRNALHLVAVILSVRPGDSDGEARPLVIQGKVQRQIVGVAAVREGGDEFRLAGADHDRRAVAPVDSAGEGAPMGLAAGLHWNRRPAGRSLKRCTRIATGFLPIEDQGYVLVTVQLPDGASLTRTKRVLDQVSEIAGKNPAVENVIAISGVSALDNNSTLAN